MKRIKLLFLALVGVVSLSAQDIHFSQFYLSPLNLNPAMTGVMNCNVRLVANYRNQWASVLRNNAFNTYSFSYDQKIPVGRYDYFGIGGTFWGDEAGAANLSTVTGKLSASYSKRMGGGRNRSHYLVLGAEGGLAQRSIDFINLRWPEQIRQGLANEDTEFGNYNNFENNLDRANFLFGDLAAGILWFSVIGDNNFYVGGAFNHLNRADVSFRSAENDFIYSRFTVHAGGEFQVAGRFGLVPGIIVMQQGPSFQLNGGTSMRFNLGNQRTGYQAFQFGAWTRLANGYDINNPEGTNGKLIADAIILSTRFDYQNFSLGFSYDINVSSLATAAPGNGSFEFAMAYKICGNERRNVYCPNF